MLMFTSDREFLEYMSEVSVALSSALSHLNVPYECYDTVVYTRHVLFDSMGE
jgi:hypothetical protein